VPKRGWETPLALVRVLVTLGFLTALFFGFGLTPRRLTSAVADADAVDLTFAVIAMAVLLVLLVLKWYLIARWLNISAHLSSAAQMYLTGTVLSNVLPTAIGGDLYRVYMLSRESGSPFGRSLLSAVLERATGYAGLLTLAAGGAAFYFLGILPGIAVSLALAGALLPACWWFERAQSSADPAPGLGLWHWKRLLSLAPNLHFAFLISIPQQALWISSAALLGRAFGVSIPWSYWTLAVTAMTLLTVVPVSVGGLGVREVGYAALLSPLGVESSKAAAVSLAIGFGPSLLSLPALLLLALLGLRSQRSPSPSAGQAEPAAPSRPIAGRR